MPVIRPSRDEDIPTITTIYGHYVLHSTCTLEITPPTIAEIASRRADVLDKNLPYLVAENAGAIVGFAYCNWFKPRAAYRFSVEHSIYVAEGMCGKGLGRQLLKDLIKAAESSGVRKMIAVIGDSANTSSIGLHRAAGFSHAGVLSSCGWKFGRWLDVILMEKSLGAGDTTAPE